MVAYGGVYDYGPAYPGAGYPVAYTSGPGDDEATAEQYAEIVANDIVANTSGYGDSGAGAGFNLFAALQPANLFGQVQKTVGQLFGSLGLVPPPALINKVVSKVPAKVASKAPTPPPTQAPMPHLQLPLLHAAQSRVSVGGGGRKPITSIQELMQRVKWAQLCNLTGSPLTVGAGATTATTINVTRTGWVLDWATNQAAGEVVASSLTYAQQPNTIFNPTPLGCWAPAAANPTPIDPIFVTMPATFNVTLTNPTAGALILTWTMSGIPAEHVDRALMDADVAEFLANRGMDIARATQGGGYRY